MKSRFSLPHSSRALTTFILFSIVLVSNSVGQGWYRQTSSTTNWLNSVKFTDSNQGWVVGDNGTIVHTANGGVTWAVQNVDSTYYVIRDVAFVNASIGWAVGSRGILHTTNGGTTWTIQYPLANLSDITFLDTNKGWAVSDVGSITHTRDGGATWSTQVSGINYPLYGISCIDTNKGWAVGGRLDPLPHGGGYQDVGVIVHTSNGGSTWTTQRNLVGIWLMSVTFVDTNNGWIVGKSGVIMHTSDGGANWSTQISGTSCYLRNTTFINASHGWAVGSSGTILHTTNGGTNWTNQSNDSIPYLMGISFINVNIGWAVGSGGTILHTTNGGSSWVPDYSSSHLPSQPVLHQNYPNPFNSSTTISFSLPQSGKVNLSVYDITGRNIETLTNAYRNAGVYRVSFDANRLPSGVYLYRLNYGNFCESRKLTILR